MLCSVTELCRNHWRILVVEGNHEVYYDSAPSRQSALRHLTEFLASRMEQEQ